MYFVFFLLFLEENKKGGGTGGGGVGEALCIVHPLLLLLGYIQLKIRRGIEVGPWK